jgi:hypothetical protein
MTRENDTTHFGFRTVNTAEKASLVPESSTPWRPGTT